MKFQDRSQIEALAKFKSQGDLVTSLLPGYGQGPDGPQGDPSDPEEPPQRSQGPGLRPVGRQGKDRSPAAGPGPHLRIRQPVAGLLERPRPGLLLGEPKGLQAGPGAAPRPPQSRHLRCELLPPPSGVDPGQVQPHLRRPHRPPRGRLVRRRRWARSSSSTRSRATSRRRVKEGGFEGTTAKRIERHIDAHLQEHYKKTAQKTFDISKKNPFDWLFIGTEENHSSEFESHLHSYLCGKVKARLHSRASDSPAKVLQEVLEVETRLKKTEEEEIVQKLITELERGGLATSGLRDTIHRLNQFEVQTLVVTHNFSRPGRICPAHKFLYLDELKCPVDDKKTDVVQDIVDEAIETVLKRGGTVRQIDPPSKLDRYGEIGAFLKYKA